MKATGFGRLGTLGTLSIAAALLMPVPCQADGASGTGFFITADGYIATNHHVIDHATKITVTDYRGKTYPAKYVRSDRTNDLAIIKIEGSFPPLPIARSSIMRKGDSVFTLGFPDPSLQGLAVKLTEGTLSSLSGIGDEPNNFQISVPVQPGNSGGPLLNREGAVVGLVVAKLNPAAAMEAGAGLPEAVNYAVKSNYLLELIDTDINVAEQIKPPPPRDKVKVLSLPDLVARVELSVVFIEIRFPDRTAKKDSTPRPPAAPPAGPPAGQPKGGSAAPGTEDFQKGEQAKREGRYADAVRYFTHAAEQGDVRCQIELAYAYYIGQGVAQNYAESARWYRKAADQGHPTAQRSLGLLYELGNGVAKDDGEAARWYRKAADQGNAAAQLALGVMYAAGRGGLAVDEAEAARLFRRAADQGNADAQNNLGALYAQGRGGLGKDEAEALRWFRKAADQGNANGERNMGSSYLQGRGVAKDDAEAVRWYRKSAEHGLAAAQHDLGTMLLGGHGTAKDEAEALKWFRKSAEQGNANGEYALGIMYAEARGGLATNNNEAVNWFRKAAAQGHAAAKAELKRRGLE